MAEDSTPKASAPSRQRRIIEALIVVVVALGLDLWSKAWAWDTLREGTSITVIKNWAYFEFGFNTGAAFSFLRDVSFAREAFIGFTVLALGYMGFLAMTIPTRSRAAFIAVALVSGGALGNLHDRLIRQMEIRGELKYGVVDFIKVFYWKGKVWPTFNVADIALVVGVLLLLLVLRNEEQPNEAHASDAAEGKAGASAETPRQAAT